MRIVIVTPALPHPFADTTGRWYYALIKELAARGHSVVSIAATEESEQRIFEARRWMANCSGDLIFHCHQLEVDRFALRRKWRNALRPRSELLQDSALVRLLERELAQGYDILHLEQTVTGWLGIGKPRTVLNVLYFEAIDRPAKTRLSWRDRKTLWQAKRAAQRCLREITTVRVLTPRLKEMAEKLYPDRDYRVISLALDPALYELQPTAEEPVIGMIGSLHWEPSRSAAERLITRIWPKVKSQIPKTKLLIAGWNAEKYLKKYLSLPDVTILQDLPHPSDFFSQASVMVYAPSRGSGMKVKVMESMAYGVPVVTTWEGVEGIDYEDGHHCRVEETDEALAARVCELLQDAAQRIHIRHAARKLIEERYSPKPVVDQMINLYEQVISDQLCEPCMAQAVPA